jgi:glycosyltransferase involved in cell wall biosynthesis
MHACTNRAKVARLKVSLVFTRYRPPHFRGGIERYTDEVGRRLLARGIDCEVVAFEEDLPSEATVPARYVPVLRKLPYAPVLSFAARTARFWRDRDRVIVQYGQLGLSVPSRCLYCIVQTTCRGEGKAAGAENARERLQRLGDKTLGALFETLTFRRARALIAIGDHIRDELVHDYGIPSSKISVIGNGVDCSAFAPPAAGRDRAAHGLKLLYVGRLVARKNVAALISALAACDDSVTCTIVGEGSERGSLEQLAASLGVSARVDFAGFRTKQALRSAYTAADALVMPSRYEGMPMVILEAKASGLPTIAADFRGARELIPEGTGLVLDDSTATGFAAAFDALVRDRARLAVMWDGARHDAVQRFDWERIVDALCAQLALT